MPGLTKRTTPDRSKIDVDDAKQLKYWTKSLGVSKEVFSRRSRRSATPRRR